MTSAVGSVLAADFGSVNTRVVMIDRVNGEYRLVARGIGGTTVGYPVDDVSVGLYRIVQDIADISGRNFYDERRRIITPERADRSGIDYFLTTASAGRPMRAVLVGLMPDISLNSARQAVAAAYIDIAAEIHLKDGRDDEARLNAILLSRPDLIFIAGGTEGGAQSALLELVRLIKLAVALTERDLRPAILYAGNSALVDEIEASFAGLTIIFLAENIRPDMEQEAFESVLIPLGKAYDAHKERHSASFNIVSDMSSSGILPTAQSYALVAEYYAKTRQQNVIAADIGSASTTLIGVFSGAVDTSIGTTIGLGHSAVALLDTVGQPAIERWLPFTISTQELKNYVLNKSLRPATVPLNQRDLYIEHALMRAGIQHLITSSRHQWAGVKEDGLLPEVGLMVVGGAGLTGTGSPGFNLMLIADTLQPSGITQVKADPFGLVPALGALAPYNTDAVVQLLEGANLEHLGTIISLSGTPAYNRPALSLRIFDEDGQSIKRDLPGGHLLRLEVPENVSVDIEMTALRGLSIGKQRKLRLALTGGTGGLLFDTRGRPFKPSRRLAERAEAMPLWLHEATGYAIKPIPAEWLQEIETPSEDEKDAATTGLSETFSAKPRRRGLFGRRKAETQPDRFEEDLELFSDILDDNKQSPQTANNKADNADLLDDLEAVLAGEDAKAAKGKTADKAQADKKAKEPKGRGRGKETTKATAPQSDDDDLGSLRDLLK